MYQAKVAVRNSFSNTIAGASKPPQGVGDTWGPVQSYSEVFGAEGQDFVVVVDF